MGWTHVFLGVSRSDPTMALRLPIHMGMGMQDFSIEDPSPLLSESQSETRWAK